MINRTDGFIKEKDGGKYLNIADKDRNSEVLKKYKEVWSGIRYCIEKINKDDSELKVYDKDYMKIKFKTGDHVPLNKVLYFINTTVVIRNIFEKDGKYYSQIFLDDCLYKV